MPAHRFMSNLVQPHAFDDALGTGEEAVNELVGQPHGFEDLGAAVGLIGGNAHLGHHLENALGDGLGVALVRLGFRHLLR